MEESQKIKLKRDIKNSLKATQRHGYKAVEKMLYSYKLLPEAIELYNEEISKIKKELKKFPKKGPSRTLIINDRETCLHYGDDTLEIRLSELQQTVLKVQSQIRLIKKALKKISDDAYYEIIEKKYFDGKTMEEISEYFGTSTGTISKHNKFLINRLETYLFPGNIIS